MTWTMGATLAGLVALAAACATTTDPAPQQETAMSESAPTGTPIVFFDIAGPDASAQSAFYSSVLGWEIGPSGAVRAPVTAVLEGQIRPDPAEAMLYFGVPDVTAALEQVAANGGTVVAPRFEVPGVVILGLFRDPAGNRMGFVEFRDGRAVVP
jgi:hypothetical protein